MELCLIDGNETQGEFRAAGVKVERSIDQRPRKLAFEGNLLRTTKALYRVENGSKVLARRSSRLVRITCRPSMKIGF